jgi:hypothetical protein
MTKIKKHFYLLGICLLFLCAGLACAQKKALETEIKVVRPDAHVLQNEIRIVRPDLSGTWKLNLLKSGFNDATAKEISENSLLVVIGQTPLEITVSLRARHKTVEEPLGEFTLYTDGRVSELPGGSTSQAAIAEWKDNKLVISSFYERRGLKTILEVLEFAISADGKTLTGTMKNAGTETGPGAKIDGSLVLDRVYSGAAARAGSDVF